MNYSQKREWALNARIIRRRGLENRAASVVNA